MPTLLNTIKSLFKRDVKRVCRAKRLSFEVLEDRSLLASFQGLGVLPPQFPFENNAYAVSADGQVVVGASGRAAYRWTSATGLVPLLDTSGNPFIGAAKGVSADGSVIVGDTGGFGNAFRWTESGAVSLKPLLEGGRQDPLFSGAAGVSGDGTVIVGQRRSIPLEAYRLSGTTAIPLGPGDSPGTTPTDATAVSSDGSVVVGYRSRGNLRQAVRWVDGVPHPLSDDSLESQANAVSADGRVVVGSRSIPIADPFEPVGANRAVRWVGDIPLWLGPLPAGFASSAAFGASGDGSVIVGTISTGPTSPWALGGDEAFIWNETVGIRPIRQALLDSDPALSGALQGWTLLAANAISRDGLTIVGYGINSALNRRESWIARLDPPPITTDLSATSITWSGIGDGVDITYEIVANSPIDRTSIGLFWAKGPSPADITSEAYSTLIQRAPGVYSIHIPATEISAVTDGATYLLNVIDHDDLIIESLSNNHVSLRLPHIDVIYPEGTTEFRITADPAMPSITVRLNEVPDHLVQSLSVNWQTRVTYRAADYPALVGQRGLGRDISSPAYDDKIVTNSTHFTPLFAVGEIAGVPIHPIRGGTLVLTAKTTIAGVDFEAMTPDEGDDRLQILGSNPDPATVSNYIENNLAVPARWPNDTQYSYRVILRQIISHESNIRQFDAMGVPLWSRDNLRGVGIMQITVPTPTDDDVWDWRRNIVDGAAIFRQKFESSVRLLTSLFNQIRDEARLLGIQVQPIRGDMQVLNAIRGYNGYNNGFGNVLEFRPVRNADGRLAVTDGRTDWEQVPARERVKLELRNLTREEILRQVPGNPFYVEDILGTDVF